MRVLKVAAGALNTTPLAWDRNRDNVLGAIAEGRAQGVGVLCLPELCLTGYGCEDAFFAPGLQEQAFAALQELLPETRGMVIGLGLPLYHEKALDNMLKP